MARHGMSTTSSGNRTLFPHSIPGKGLSAVQLGGSGGSGSFIAICTFLNDVRLKLVNHCYSITVKVLLTVLIRQNFKFFFM